MKHGRSFPLDTISTNSKNTASPGSKNNINEELSPWPFTSDRGQTMVKSVTHFKTCLQEEKDKMATEMLYQFLSSNVRTPFNCCEREWQHYKDEKNVLSQLFV